MTSGAVQADTTVRSVGYAYPWDYEGDPAAAERAARLGLDSVALAATYHATRAGTPWHPDHRVVDAQWAACYVPVLESVWRGSIASPGTLRRSKARPTPRDSSDWLARACRLEARVATHVGLVRPGPVIAG